MVYTDVSLAQNIVLPLLGFSCYFGDLSVLYTVLQYLHPHETKLNSWLTIMANNDAFTGAEIKMKLLV